MRGEIYYPPPMTYWDEDEQYVPEPYCDYCEREGHTFRSCPARDDDYGDEST